jgi:hypothetical protein
MPSVPALTSASAWRRLSRLAAALSAVGQLVLVALAPYSEARAGQSAPEHVEQTGTGHHYAHDATTCLSCAARHAIGKAERVHVPLPAPRREAGRQVASLPVLARSLGFDPVSPRAPPVTI